MFPWTSCVVINKNFTVIRVPNAQVIQEIFYCHICFLLINNIKKLLQAKTQKLQAVKKELDLLNSDKNVNKNERLKSDLQSTLDQYQLVSFNLNELERMATDNSVKNQAIRSRKLGEINNDIESLHRSVLESEKQHSLLVAKIETLQVFDLI